MSFRAAHSSTSTSPTTRPTLVVVILALTGLTVSVMQTVVVPLLPHLPSILSTSPESSTWVLTLTLMVGAVFTPIAGRLGDMVGKKRMLLISTSMMVIGSLICAAADGLVAMLVGRGLQGLSLGSIALGISLMRDVLPKERLGSAVALMSATLGIGGAMGLPLSALIAQHTSWRYLFLASSLLGAAAFAAILFAIPDSPVRSGGAFDIPGAIVFTFLLLTLLFALTKTASWGWGDWRVLTLIAVAAALVPLFIGIQRRSRSPMVDIAVSLRPTVLYTNLASILLGFAMYTCNLVITQLLQAPTYTGYGYGQSMVVAGLCAAPMGFLMMAVSPFAARLIDSHGARFSFLSGIAVIALGFTAGIFMVHAAWELIIVSMIVGAGIALSYAAAPTLIMRSVPHTQTAAANSVNTLSRSIGTSLASAVHGALLANALVPGGISYGPLDPFHLCFALAAGACVIAFLIALRIPADRLEQPVVGSVAQRVEATADQAVRPAARISMHSPRRPVVPRARVVRRSGARRPAGRSARK